MFVAKVGEERRRMLVFSIPETRNTVGLSFWVGPGFKCWIHARAWSRPDLNWDLLLGPHWPRYYETWPPNFRYD